MAPLSGDDTDTSSRTIAVRFEHVSKRYGERDALRVFSLEIPAGGIFGLAGRNGAGKSTALRALLGLTAIDAGKITLFDDQPNVRIGYVPENVGQYRWMTAREYLELGAKLTGVPESERAARISTLIEQVHLADAPRLIGSFTTSMHQQLGIAFAMIAAPQLMVLDEPTSELDPMEEHELLGIISSFRDETTIIFSSHILRDIELLADSIAIVDQGRVIAAGKLQQLRVQPGLQSRMELVHPSLEDVFLSLTRGVS